MHLCTRITLLVAIASVTKCTEFKEGLSHDVETQREGKGLSHVHEAHVLEGEKMAQEYIPLRDGRKIKKNKKDARLNFGILDSFLDIDFESGNCTTGKCMSQKDCKNMNGTHTEVRCVGGYGVCCVVEGQGNYMGGNTTITGDGGDFLNPGSTEVARHSARQGMVETVTYVATVIPAAEDVQIKVNIRELNIMGPVEGDCDNDTLIITGTNPGPEVPKLCGVVTNQILYLDIDNTPGPILFTMMITVNNTIDQTWNISISFLKEADAVPRRCLQYHTATQGTIQTFNYGGNPPMMINDQTYSICFAYVTGYCNIGFNSEMMNIPCGYGYLLIGDSQECGNLGETTITANATGPIIIGVRSGSLNELEAEGVSLTYTMLGC